MKKLLVSIALAATLVSTARAQGVEPLSITSGDKTHAFQVEVVNTAPAIKQGLGGRTSLAKDHGLLMDLRTIQGDDTVINMKGVTVELDMLFLDTDGTIRAIAVSARPGSLRGVTPGLAAAAVLQIPGGQSAALGLKPGDNVNNKIFGNGG